MRFARDIRAVGFCGVGRVLGTSSSDDEVATFALFDRFRGDWDADIRGAVFARDLRGGNCNLACTRSLRVLGAGGVDEAESVSVSDSSSSSRHLVRKLAREGKSFVGFAPSIPPLRVLIPGCRAVCTSHTVEC